MVVLLILNIASILRGILAFKFTLRIIIVKLSRNL